jgi:simple sugar transport system ATP-binding protein
MTTTEKASAPAATPLLEIRYVSKFFGNVIALKGVSTEIRTGQVTCVLGDNGAGKSTLIKILSGVHPYDEGRVLMDGEVVRFGSPREAKAAGIATVFQDLATVPLMPIWRNFWLGFEPTKGWGPLRRIDTNKAKRIAREELLKMGIDLRNPDQPVGTLSGGERQAVAISRAVYFGARLLILDEPTSALGVKQAGVVLKYIIAAKERGVGVILITHNPHHAFPVGDRFMILNRGRTLTDKPKGEITLDELVVAMAGGAELQALTHELQKGRDG